LLIVSTCSFNNNKQIFNKDSSEFVIQSDCVPLSNQGDADINIQGVVWYKEDSILHSGDFGLKFIGNSKKDTGVLPVTPVQMIVSPNGKVALFDGYDSGTDFLNWQVYELSKREHKKTEIKWQWNSPVWTKNNLILGTSWSDEHGDEHGIVTVTTTDLETSVSQQITFTDFQMSIEPAAQIARNGILTYMWYRNFDGPRLVVYDTKTNKEVARYKDITYQIRPSCYGYLLNPEGTRILSISSLAGEKYDGYQQELFGVEIGKEPIQITDFHSKYPNTLIYHIDEKNWSPDNRWIIIHVITSETRDIDEITDPSTLFLIDMQRNIAYQFCQVIHSLDYQSITWSPDSKYFALALNDKIWVVNPKTLESHLLVERPKIPLTVLGWTMP